MPPGFVHYRNWKAGWIVTTIASALFLYLENWYVAIGLIVGYGLGYWLDNDLDQISITSAEGRMLKIPILGWFLVAYSSFYGAIFRNHHRSFWTHFPIFSTAIRVVYFFWWIGLLYHYQWITFQDWHVLFYGSAFAGLSFADYIHWFADTFDKTRYKTRS